MQLVSVMMAPTERSSPPSSTGTVCAMARNTMATDSLLFWIRTAAEKPRGCNML